MSASAGRSWRPLAALLVVCGVLLAPLGYPGYFQPHTGFQPVYTLYAWEAAGHPLSHMAAYSPTGRIGGDGILPYALAALFRLLGADGPTAVKAVFAIAVLLAAGGFYALARRRCPRVSDLAAIGLALAWTGSPMMLASVYVRGSPGGSLALGFLPWLALALTMTSDRPRRPAERLCATLVSVALCLSHPGFALLSGVTVAALAWLRRQRVDPWPLLALAIVGAAGLLATFDAAAAPFLQFSRPYQWLGQSVGYAVHSDPWGPGVPAPLTLGFLPLGLFAAAALLPRSGAQRPRAPIVGAVLVLGLLLLSTDLARPLWQSSLGAALDGPWQLVALACFALLWVATPAAVGLLQGRGAPGAALALLALILAIPFLDVPLTQAAPAAHPLATFDGGRILLVGAELHGPLRHGATPRLRLYWQATEPLAHDYTVFVHVVDDDGTKWGQRDSWPVDGARPTTSWRPGEIIVDEHSVYVDLEGPREGYHLVIGLYDLETGERLALPDGETALELGRDD